ncbi:MAG: hypothetical protein GY839_19780, partial [candidate division Zixibacteria bacterium]|nr:hypothetical protein [candidate division Zixibacteria bacterium]
MAKKIMSLLMVLALILLTTPFLISADDNWSLHGKFDGPSTLSGKGMKVKETIPANSTVRVYHTNNGNDITNDDGTKGYYEYHNTGNAGVTKDLKTAFEKINGKKVTDLRQETIDNPTAILQAGAFDSDTMVVLTDWLYSSGYVGDTWLDVPDFDKGYDSLYFGVDLNLLSTRSVTLSLGDIGSTYDVISGIVDSRISGTGPSASQLQDYFISNAPCTLAAGGGWTSSAPFTGTMTLSSFHELSSDLVGEDCETPITINFLPVTHVDNSCNYEDDIGYSGDDVVYQLNLAECMDVTISLCNTDPIFDTYLWLYPADDCGGTPIAEDDDYCTSPDYGTSEIQATLSAGTYFIGVDAYTGQCGEFTLDVTGTPAGPAPANDACAGAINIGFNFPVTDVCGTTECATMDCPDVLGWNEVWYKFTLLTASSDVTVDYCPTGDLAGAEMPSVGLVLYTTCPTDSTSCEDYILADDYEFVECTNGSTNPIITWRRLSGPATYYLPVHTGTPMDFCFDIDAAEPCDIVCEPGYLLEGEGECYDGYDDDYNSGCNYEGAPPAPTVAIADGDTICGTSGTHLDGAEEAVRDTDWYRFDLGPDLREFRFGAVGEFPMQLLIIKANSEDCADYSIVSSGDSEVCDTLTISYTGTGVYWLWAGPAAGESVNCSYGNYVCWVNVTPPLEYDAFVVSVDDPPYHRMAANSTTDIKASVTNLGITAYDFDVDVSISGDISGEVYTSSGSVSGLTQADTVQLTFNTFTPDCVENFTMTVTCSGTGEENTENDTRDYMFRNQAWGRDGYHDGSSYWVSSMTGYPTWATRFHVPSGHTAVLTSGEMNFHSFEAPPAEASDITPWICFSDGDGEPDYASLQWVSPTVYTVGPANETHVVTFDLSSVGPFSQDFWLGFDAVVAAGADEQANMVGECETCIEDAPINNRMLVDGTWRLLDDIWANPSDIAIWCDYDLTAGTYNDGAVISIDSPAPAHIGAGPHDVLVTVANTGLVAITGATLEIDIGGDFYGIDNSVNIPAGSSLQIDFGDWTASVGGQEYIIDVNFTVAGDMDECNNDMVGASYIIAGDEVYSEDFEASDGGYTEVIHSGVTIWQHGEDDSTGAGNDVWGTILNSVYPDDACASLLMPPQVIGPAGGALVVDFWYQIETPGDPWDFGNVKISIDDGETFALLPPFGGYD